MGPQHSRPQSISSPMAQDIRSEVDLATVASICSQAPGDMVCGDVPTKIIFPTPSDDWLPCVIPAFLTGLGSHTGLGFLLYSSLIPLRSQLRTLKNIKSCDVN